MGACGRHRGYEMINRANEMMNRANAVELAQQMEELIFVTVNKIDGMRRENSINGLADAIMAFVPKESE
jgi:hypothetical protein